MFLYIDRTTGRITDVIVDDTALDESTLVLVDGFGEPLPEVEDGWIAEVAAACKAGEDGTGAWPAWQFGF